jgi:hypothetical protein
MTFTDEDLKWLKEDLKELGDFLCQECGLNQNTDFSALIARLEAAEKVCLYEEVQSQRTPVMASFLAAWRKAAGK